MTKVDPVDAQLLWGKPDTFSEAEKQRRRAYVKDVLSGGLEPPHHEWLTDRGDGVSGDAASLITTSIYSIVVDSRSYQREDSMPAGGLPDILETGGDAELWTLIRIALDEVPDEDLLALLESLQLRRPDGIRPN